MSTPLYKSLNPNGVSFYAFPSAREDLGQSFQNPNYSFYFSHFALLNIPVQRLEDEPIMMNFDDSSQFPRAQNIINKPDDAKFSNKLVESLRNYVANKDETLRASKNSPNSYYYDQNILKSPSERIFYQWLKKLNILQFEVADGPKEVTNGPSASVDYGEDWTWNLPSEVDDMQGVVNKYNRNNPKYFKEGYWYEVFWKERVVISIGITMTNNNLNIIDSNAELSITVNESNAKQKKLKVGDFIKFTGTILDIHKQGHPNFVPLPESAIELGYTGLKVNGKDVIHKIKKIILPSTNNDKMTIIIDNPNLSVSSWVTNYTTDTNPLSVELYYNRVIQYVGEITDSNHSERGNKVTKEVTAYVPEQSGATPKILFRTSADKNYRPGISFPFIPAQWEQREIQGGENSNNPLYTNPADYPGSYWAFFDRADINGSKWQYTISSGDFLKRTGDFFGVFFYDRAGNQISVPGDEPFEVKYLSDFLDGISIDFNTSRYKDMNTVNEQFPERTARNFEEYNAIPFNGQPPKDFEFNAVLWYYTVFDENTGKSTQNLYGVSFLDHPDNACDADNQKIVPTIRKYAPNDLQDGSGYILNLDLNFNIVDEQLISKFDPTSGQNLRDYIIYNDVISKMTEFNDNFMILIEDSIIIKQDIYNLKSLIYSENDIQLLNQKIQNLETYLNLFSTLQIEDSDTIVTSLNLSNSPPTLKLNSISKQWSSISSIKTTLLYDSIFSIVNDYAITVTRGTSFLVEIINDDTLALSLSNNQSLQLYLDKDMTIGQTCRFIIYPENSNENKKLSLKIANPSWVSSDLSSNQWFYLFKNLDLPVDSNPNYFSDVVESNNTNLDGYGLIKRNANLSELTLDSINSIWSIITPESELVIILNKYYPIFAEGDSININDLVFSYFNASSNSRQKFILSGQRKIKRIINNIFITNKGALDQLLNLSPTPNTSNFPKNCTCLIFDMENEPDFDGLTNVIKNLVDTNNNSLNPDKYRLDSLESNSWDSTKKSINFLYGSPLIFYNKGWIIDIVKQQHELYEKSFIIDIIKIDELKTTLDK